MGIGSIVSSEGDLFSDCELRAFSLRRHGGRTQYKDASSKDPNNHNDNRNHGEYRYLCGHEARADGGHSYIKIIVNIADRYIEVPLQSLGLPRAMTSIYPSIAPRVWAALNAMSLWEFTHMKTQQEKD